MRTRMLPPRLDPAQRVTVLLARSVHLGELGDAEARAGTARRQGLSSRDIDSLLAGGVPTNRSLAKLVATTWLVLDSGGKLDPGDWDALRTAGVEPPVAASVARLLGIELR